MCNIKYKNDLPQIPCDPKMLVAELQPARLAKFFLTTIEQNSKRDLVLPPDLGISLSLLEPERYSVPAEKPPLDPADEALLGGADDKYGTSTYASPAKKPLREAPHNAELSWLMRTTYISNDYDLKRGAKTKAPFQPPVRGKPLTPHPPSLEEGEAEVQQQIAEIEATFEAAQRPPVHSRDPTLRPVEVLPLLPDFEAWTNKYVTVHYDNDPTQEVDMLKRLEPRKRKKVAERAMLKSFTIESSQADRGGEHANNKAEAEVKLMALLVPKDLSRVAVDKDDSAGHPSTSGSSGDVAVDAAQLEGEYQWLKEYAYTIKTRGAEEDQNQVYVLRFKDGAVGYSTLEGKIMIRKKKRSAVLLKPEKITVKRRANTEGEEADRRSKIARLYDEVPGEQELEGEEGLEAAADEE